MGLSLLLFVLGFSIAWSETCDYAQYSPTHTMCRYTEPACNLIIRGLSEDEINVIVDTHNELRNKVATDNSGQPAAADMKQLEWDPELARIAQRLIEQCNATHDNNKDRRSHKYEYVGQNIGMQGSSAQIEHADLKAHVEAWYYKEIVHMDPSYVSSFPNNPEHGVIGHYTQVVWADSEAVGCGLVEIKDGKWYKTLLACNYGPGGNMIGAPIYTQGPACTACQNGCSDQYEGLCN